MTQHTVEQRSRPWLALLVALLLTGCSGAAPAPSPSSAETHPAPGVTPAIITGPMPTSTPSAALLPAPTPVRGASVSASPTGEAMPQPTEELIPVASETRNATQSPSPTASTANPAPFTTVIPPPGDATWTGVRWRKLAPDNPLALVRSVLRWRDGFIAVGWGSSGTPVWTSPDGAHWKPLRFDTATTFGRATRVIGMAEVPTGLVALTLLAGPNDCGESAYCPTYLSPLVAWTSPDGRTWTPHDGPDLTLPNPIRDVPVLASGPAGLVAVSTYSNVRPTDPTIAAQVAHAATSVDGLRWTSLPVGAFPSGLRIGDLVGTANGYTAVGALTVDLYHDRAVAMQSVDGRTWTGPFPMTASTTTSARQPSPLQAGVGFVPASTGPSEGALRIVTARYGFIAMGGVPSIPGRALWWQSANGSDWRPLSTYEPLGPTTCVGSGCGYGPNGVLIGDGERLVAFRGGEDAALWASLDGLQWQRLILSRDIPMYQMQGLMGAALLPGGVLYFDETTTWFGDATWR